MEWMEGSEDDARAWKGERREVSKKGNKERSAQQRREEMGGGKEGWDTATFSYASPYSAWRNFRTVRQAASLSRLTGPARPVETRAATTTDVQTVAAGGHSGASPVDCTSGISTGIRMEWEGKCLERGASGKV